MRFCTGWIVFFKVQDVIRRESSSLKKRYRDSRTSRSTRSKDDANKGKIEVRLRSELRFCLKSQLELFCSVRLVQRRFPDEATVVTIR